MDVCDYVESLYQATTFDEALATFNSSATALGFEATLYAFMPRAIVNQSLPPVFAVSENFCPEFLAHYEGARFDKNDPLISAVANGETQPIDWFGSTCNKYIKNRKSQEVMSTALSYGIHSGLTIPLMSEQRGISGASFISTESKGSFSILLAERQDQLVLRSRLFHSMVASNALHASWFIKPIVETLSKTEIAFLAGLAAGKSPTLLAHELNRSEKYLEQVMLKVRRKLSGVSHSDTPTINRNQVLYYAGLLNMLETQS